jgi:SAM-dependent methyltransferase
MPAAAGPGNFSVGEAHASAAPVRVEGERVNGFKQHLRQAMINLLPKRSADAILALKHRHTWRTDQRSHLTYHEEYATRGELVNELQRWAPASGREHARVLEFGCSGANNLRLMRERGMGRVDYCGLDINAKAIDFARRTHPDARFHVCDDIGFARLAPQLGRFDGFLAFAVLYYIPAARVQSLLQTAAGIADHLFICDDLSRFDAEAGSSGGLFLHPWAAMCREVGLDIVHGPVQSNEAGNRHGFFVARSRSAPTRLSATS